jgi:hypothetical protein
MKMMKDANLRFDKIHLVGFEDQREVLEEMLRPFDNTSLEKLLPIKIEENWHEEDIFGHIEDVLAGKLLFIAATPVRNNKKNRVLSWYNWALTLIYADSFEEAVEKGYEWANTKVVTSGEEEK